MEITNVNVRIMENSNPKMKAFCSITFDDELVVKDVRILEKAEGELFLAFPNKPMSPGEFKDVVHPVNQAARDKFTEVVVAKYKEELEKKNQ